ncbi:TPA: helix-turn-helix domain-containing protein [Campylobacter jejuni]|uniref:helix-turn-helix domain-containing protein n=1 Tax=Campylobacter jejuni TaxID=197 RepID=UPI000A91AD27|nr:helix-turn-helix domain-containing protein [Campylobacter jejuni]EJQ2689012.1 helix-turn-helix domain-containing protein [Campylobacter jejuni]MCW1872142.1 helix-turn-helix domain-containing protein [Campylobacter jejuni]HEC1701495.1 helix-turn-helix domain-containing protein [Campylobacter jejuni]HED7663403.1 helix-turn-helix domain-containing protein [Campylobacter jejuni]HED8092964.1 helix-turn-helix domain-containing protein [Campylobacter jejuni]
MKIIKKLQEDGSFKEQTYYSVDEVAKMYSVTHTTVRTWISRGALKSLKLGKGYYISKETILDFQKIEDPPPKKRRGKMVEKYYNREEIAKMLNVNILTIRNWVKSGYIKEYKISTNVRKPLYNLEEIEKN